MVFDDFSGPVLGVAEKLLGKRLVTRIGGETTSVVICEVEAYGGADDPASHAFSGPGRRNRTMFSEAGTLYVYRSYGVHWCANVVTGPEGRGEAVLLRGGRPEWGSETMIARRGRDDHLCDGPGKLTQALGVDGGHDGLALSAGRKVWLEETAEGPPESMRTPRVGISRATERLWRFVAVGVGYRSPHGTNRGAL
ncbi:MAG: DNA-3-methyladenine glycosylase [Acidimicrobiia bacterium]|nr:DNA-3-methyladenine glycosylase [Acidimicrobiia bacterium]MYA39968.1 DNA-3-methyladenine glycosylase [Acidimicrobiia bacterium]